MSERAVQHSLVQLYHAVGCRTFNLSQPRATMQARGLPDLYVLCPRKRAAWWHEVKGPGGKARPEQVTFAELCAASGVGHVLGGVAEAKAHLRGIGVLP